MMFIFLANYEQNALIKTQPVIFKCDITISKAKCAASERRGAFFSNMSGGTTV